MFTFRGVINLTHPGAIISTPRKLPSGTNVFLGKEDLTPVAPANGPSWSVRSFGNEIFEAQGLSEVIEYLTYTTADECIPAISFHRLDKLKTDPVVKVSFTAPGRSIDLVAQNLFWYGIQKLLVHCHFYYS